ncbi:DUF4411 family protein [Fulvivirgaceae bacterium BMA12]|uniref:DUF4411 family protein n=1 Tax=Agaribacillus aureus TaxID=3051825 RepID=A0ABT8L149_9BACT|nr:DUF4411 family protein [Fulvivirgaceae bacterium BMA12]
MSVYLVDTNFFIQAHRATYPLDVAKSFWEKLSKLALEGKIISIDRVKHEIYENEDDLKDWCIDNLPNNFFKSTRSIASEYGKAVEWAMSRNDHYTQAALAEFMDDRNADAWLVSYALAHTGLIIVTQEKSEPAIKRKIKIPEACAPFDIKYLNTVGMFRELGESF